MTTIHLVRRVGPLSACMGGFCNQRESCARYWQRDTRTPAERLCERGTTSQWCPIDAPRWGASKGKGEQAFIPQLPGAGAIPSSLSMLGNS